MTHLIRTATAAVITLAACAAALADGPRERSVHNPSGKTRAEVRAELEEAQRTGRIVGDRQGRTQAELSPGRYPLRPAAGAVARQP